LDLSRPDHRKKFLDAMLTVAATIPDAAARDQFADRLSHKARITEGVVRDEIRKAAAQRKPAAPIVAVSPVGALRPAEQGLLWALVHRPVEAKAAVVQIEADDLEGLLSASILQLAIGLGEVPPNVLPDLLRERLNEGERAWLGRAASADAPAAPAADCVSALRRLRLGRDLAAVQEEIDQLDQRSRDNDALSTLWARKKDVLRLLEALNE
jgi:DnaB-helicase binding domain of primase